MALSTAAGLPASAHAAPADDRRSFMVIFVVAFALFLMIAVIAEALMVRWRPWFPGAESEKSLIGGVRAAVSTFMPLLI
ncbi:hypothetical protein AACH06_10650 [Ideonella sp. DXS29W]|uniref:Uncharacterized protein n=1 Tax=Ideonella lacteola TaxID=2984193 RepID=A0ABU9BNC9_9BURK